MDGLKHNLKVIAASLLAIALTVGLWRSLYGYGTISVVSLIPLSILISIGSYHTFLGRRQASLDSILTESTRLRNILKGRVISAVQALIVAVGGIFLIAYKGLAAEQWEVFVATLTVVFAAVSFTTLVMFLAPRVNKKYLFTAASNINIWLVGTVFFLIYIYALWNIQEHPPYLTNQPLPEAINAALNELPQGKGITAIIVEIVFTLEKIKIWSVVNSAKIVSVTPVVYVLYGAIFGYFQVKVITSVVCAVSLIITTKKFEGDADE